MYLIKVQSSYKQYNFLVYETLYGYYTKCISFILISIFPSTPNENNLFTNITISATIRSCPNKISCFFFLFI